jgi:hypothetical protein
VTVYSRRGKRQLFTAYLLGAASLLAVEGLIAGIASWPPAASVPGTPHAVAPPEPVAQLQQTTAPSPAPLSAEPPVATNPASTPVPSAPSAPSEPSAPSPQAGTVRLPAGGVARLVRQDVHDGVLPVPAQLNRATWWGADLHAQRGASVFAGHINWCGRIGPFAELWTARIGQEVTVTDFDGMTAVYRISQLFSLNKDELPQRAPNLFAQTGTHRIVLVTCGGEWVGGAQGYAQNRVVLADPE